MEVFIYSPDKNVFATIAKSTEYIGPQLQEEYEKICMCSGLLKNMSILYKFFHVYSILYRLLYNIFYRTYMYMYCMI